MSQFLKSASNIAKSLRSDGIDMREESFASSTPSLSFLDSGVSSEATAFMRASSNVLPIPMTSPMDFIWTPILRSTSNLSNGHLGIFTVM